MNIRYPLYEGVYRILTVVASYRRKMYDLTVVGCMILPL